MCVYVDLQVSCSSSRFNIYWSGTHIHLSEVRGLLPHQRINHFPRFVSNDYIAHVSVAYYTFY